MSIKRYIAAAAAAATLGGGAFAFAANLSVTSNTLASGSDTVDAGCSGITTSYTTRYDTAADVFELASVTVKGGTNCDGDLVKVSVQRGSTTDEFGGANGTALDATNGTTFNVDAAAHIPAHDVSNIAAVVTGPSEG